MKKLLTIAACLMATVLLNAQTTVYVKSDGTGNGTSWATACNLETAVKNATSGTQIWVQKGTYYPTKMLNVMPSVKVYGGFAGTETALSQRNLAANPTIVDAQQKFGSIFRLGVSSELDGFTVQNGNAQNNPNYNGGGVWADENTTIRYCTIVNNTAFANGGGIYAKGNLTLFNATVENNTATGEGADFYGNCISAEILIDYTGAPQEVVLKPGTYQIECWGAQGGSYRGNGSAGNQGSIIAYGACGGYAAGTITTAEPLTLYAYVGQLGGTGGTKRPGYSDGGIAGWNGGGTGGGDFDNDVGGAGGGASDIRLVSGVWNDAASLRSRIMVAGGGGGSNPNGVGGGLNGGIGNNLGQSTQTEGYTFGAGQTGATQVADWFGGNGGGGGGWYGGRADANRGSGHSSVAGNGGSGFISGHPGCNAVDENGTHTGSPAHYSGIEFTGTKMLMGNQSMPNPRGEGEITGNPGHGFIRITIFLN